MTRRIGWPARRRNGFAAAALFQDFTLTVAMTPSDFVWQGFMQGKRDGCREWPVEGELLFSNRGKPLPYLPFCYRHPDYWHCIASESKRTGDMVNSCKLFDDSEAAHPLRPEAHIPVENIRGKLLLIGAEDAASGLGPLCEMGLPGSQKISEGMPADPERHRQADAPGSGGMEGRKVK